MNEFKIVGILNITPDSYFDGGKFTAIDAAIEQAGKMINEGADIIEIGGESTGPGSKDVSGEEEMRRILPIVRAIQSRYPNAQLSIDTHKSAIAKAALEEGVTMVNDVTAGRSDPNIFRIVAEADASLVLMYAKDTTPRTTIEKTQYDDVIRTISGFLSERKSAAIEAGVASGKIILDPGLGHFVSSDPQYSFEIIRRLRELRSLGSPLFLSPSRKSFLAGPHNLPTAERLPATVVASAVAVQNGAAYIRTHDVHAVRLGCETAMELLFK